MLGVALLPCGIERVNRGIIGDIDACIATGCNIRPLCLPEVADGAGIHVLS